MARKIINGDFSPELQPSSIYSFPYLMKALSLPHQVLESKNWRGRQEVTVKVRPGPKLGGGVGISIGVEGRI